MTSDEHAATPAVPDVPADTVDVFASLEILGVELIEVAKETATVLLQVKTRDGASQPYKWIRQVLLRFPKVTTGSVDFLFTQFEVSLAMDRAELDVVGLLLQSDRAWTVEIAGVSTNPTPIVAWSLNSREAPQPVVEE